MFVNGRGVMKDEPAKETAKLRSKWFFSELKANSINNNRQTLEH